MSKILRKSFVQVKNLLAQTIRENDISEAEVISLLDKSRTYLNDVLESRYNLGIRDLAKIFAAYGYELKLIKQ